MGSFSDSQLKLHRWLKDKFTKLVARTGFLLRAPPEGVGQCVAVCRHICPCGIFLEQRRRPQGQRHEGCMRRASHGHVLPPDVERVRMLILGLDEGSIGTAGVAAGAFLLKKTIWGKFDKIHRVIRDLKLADGGCCNKVFEKAKLWSAYIFGLNNRPFGSGTNHSLKEL